jgi:proton-translocating NADH-quinone oxidoreductase chain N
MSTLLVIVPLLGVLALNLPLRSLVRARAAFWFGLALCTWQLVMVVRPHQGFWDPARKLPLLRLLPLVHPPTIDNTALVMFLAIAIVGAVALLVARHAVADAGKLFNFSNLLVLAVAGMNGMVLAGDLFSLYIFLEVTAVASFVLIAFERGRDAFEGAFKYIVLSAAATAMILAAIALLMMAAGGVALADLGPVWESTRGVGHSADRVMVAIAAALLLGGLAIKSGLVPFHGWLPDAYSAAPAPTSVLLAGIVTKTTGVYALIRVVTVMFPPDSFAFIYGALLLIGAITVVIGALAALGQTDFKRMLAYSSISQVGYIILGLGAGVAAADPDPRIARFAAVGLVGAVFHLFNHAVFKTLLFVNAAAVEQQSGTRDMGRLGGITDRMPVTGLTSAIAFLSTAGIPPLAGFWSKLLIIVALWGSGHKAYAAIAILASVITLAYFLVMQRKVFFGKLAAGLENLEEAGAWNTFACCFLAAITLAVGVGAPWLFGTFLLPIGSIL